MGASKSFSALHLSDVKDLNVCASSNYYCTHNRNTASRALMRGRFIYRQVCDGIEMHGGCVEELKDSTHCTEINAGLSFNFLFEGQIDFSVAGTPHVLGNKSLKPVECSAIVLSHDDFISRRMQQGMTVCKVNIFVSRSWLEKRCTSQKDIEWLYQLFKQHAEVHYWSPSKDLVTMVEQVLQQQEQASSCLAGLKEESLFVHLVSVCLEELTLLIEGNKDLPKNPISHKVVRSQTPIMNKKNQNFKKKVDNIVDGCQNINDLASALNISSSSLQRKFKATFGMTVME